MNNSSLNDEIEKDVLPWLRLAEDLRVLQLDVEVRYNRYLRPMLNADSILWFSQLKMPQICVMGDQSSGKSSVLEALSGIPFPRGAGLVTRCPIRMVMKKARAGEAWSAVLSTTLNPEEKQTAKDVPQLSSIMNRLMQKLCVDEVNFSTDSVVVELVSPDASDLTVVDLPGIIRTVTMGQSVQCIEQVNRLIKSCLLDERTIILAVIPANQVSPCVLCAAKYWGEPVTSNFILRDLCWRYFIRRLTHDCCGGICIAQDIATVDILERAEGVDPAGQRTIGVLTKCDLIGPGAEDEVLEVVNNRRKPLALGYTMVKNRSQKEIKDGTSSAKARYVLYFTLYLLHVGPGVHSDGLVLKVGTTN
jgi:interferon-induced GTP-binding protein Mx1